jgi:hypothetical protein
MAEDKVLELMRQKAKGASGGWLSFNPPPFTEEEASAMFEELVWLEELHPMSTFERHAFTDGWQKSRRFHLYRQQRDTP